MLCIPKANHRKLVDDCYPPSKALPNAGPEYRPNSNELGRLCYYAQVKPAKLQKLGELIAARAAVQSRAFGAAPSERTKAPLMITLGILKELVAQTTGGEAYLAPSLGTALTSALGACGPGSAAAELGADVSVRAASTFSLFMRKMPVGTLETNDGVAQAVYNVLPELVRRTETSRTGGRFDELAWMTCLSGLDGVVHSPSMHTSASVRLLSFVMPVLLVTVNPVHLPLEQTAELARSDMTALPEVSRETVSAAQTVSAALSLLHDILTSSDAVQLRAVMRQTFLWLDMEDGRHTRWEHAEWSVWILGVLAQWARPASRYVVPHTLAEALTEPYGRTAHLPLRSTRLLQALQVILASKTEILGLDMTEILDGHVHFLLAHVQRDPTDAHVSAALEAIAQLAAHPSYSDQMEDFVQQIAQHLDSEQWGDHSATVQQNCINALLYALMAIFRVHQGRTHVPLSAWRSTEALLLSHQPAVRATYLYALYTYLIYEQDRVARGDAIMEASPDSLSFLHSLSSHVVALASYGLTGAQRAVTRMPHLNDEAAHCAQSAPSDFAMLRSVLDMLLLIAPTSSLLVLAPALLTLDQVSAITTAAPVSSIGTQTQACRWLLNAAFTQIGTLWEIPGVLQYCEAHWRPLLRGFDVPMPALPEHFTPVPELPAFAPQAAPASSTPAEPMLVAEALASSTAVQAATHAEMPALRSWFGRNWTVASALYDAKSAARPSTMQASPPARLHPKRTMSPLARAASVKVSELRQALVSQAGARPAVPLSAATATPNGSTTSRRRARSVLASHDDVGAILDRFSVSPRQPASLAQG